MPSSNHGSQSSNQETISTQENRPTRARNLEPQGNALAAMEGLTAPEPEFISFDSATRGEIAATARNDVEERTNANQEALRNDGQVMPEPQLVRIDSMTRGHIARMHLNQDRGNEQVRQQGTGSWKAKVLAEAGEVGMATVAGAAAGAFTLLGAVGGGFAACFGSTCAKAAKEAMTWQQREEASLQQQQMER